MKTYANPKYGYEIQIPLNWWNDRSDFDRQYYSNIQSPSCGGGGGMGVFLAVLDNSENLPAGEFLKRKLSDPQYQNFPIKILDDRMGFSEDLDVALSEGYPGAGSPGPSAEINTGRGQIVEIRTESPNFPLETIFSTFRLTDPHPDLEETLMDVVDVGGASVYIGDIAVTRGGRTVRITDWGFNSGPELSPDGSKIAFLSVTAEDISAGDREPNAFNSPDNVWIINVDGTNPVKVTEPADGVHRGDLHWLDDNRLLFSDENSTLKMYSLDTGAILTVLGPGQSAPDRFNPAVFLYNSDFSYLLRLESYSRETYIPIAIVDLATLQVKMSADSIFPMSCDLEFGPDNTTFLGSKTKTFNSESAILDLKTGKVTYGSAL